MRKNTIASRCCRLTSRYCRMAGVAEAGEEEVVPEYNIAAMVILALETVTRRGSLALVTGDQCDARPGGTTRTHAERLPLEAVALLADHGLTLREVDRFAIVAGPGSFTGLRVGMAAVQGWALAGGRQVVPVPTLEAM